MILHKHDTCTFLHLQADMSSPQWRERARRTSQGTHGTAARGRKGDVAGRCEAYNLLNLMLLGA